MQRQEEIGGIVSATILHYCHIFEVTGEDHRSQQSKLLHLEIIERRAKVLWLQDRVEEWRLWFAKGSKKTDKMTGTQ
jgi:hypothetical protein